MTTIDKNKAREIKWQGMRYSAIFSRQNFTRLLKRKDYAVFNNAINSDEVLRSGKREISTYAEVIDYAYKYLINNYREEYVYKNSLISYLIKKHGKRDVVMFNEFAAGNSIGDIACFNSKSVVYEIKTEFDSPKRIRSQMEDYKKIFQQRYVVVFENHEDEYLKSVDKDVGIMILKTDRVGEVTINLLREAEVNMEIDPHALIRSLRTNEYKKMVLMHYGELPKMSASTAFSVCESLIGNIPQEILSKMFVTLMKERKNNTSFLMDYMIPLRQICLSMHIGQNEYNKITERLNKKIE